MVKFVVLQSHSQSICVLNQCHIRINTHLVSHIETFCFSIYFFPHEICLIVASVFIQLSCNNLFGSVCGKERKSKSHTRYFFFQELTIPNQQTKKATSLFGNFSVFPWRAKKSSEIRLGFAANGFVLFPLSF